MSGTPNPAGAFPITPSDTAALPAVTDYISWVNSGAQTITLKTLRGQSVALGALPSGMYPIRASMIFATGTSVTSIVGWIVS